MPLRLNLGQIYFLQDETRNAVAYYDRVAELESSHPLLLLAKARANHKLENCSDTQAGYHPARCGYLDLRGRDGSRASAADRDAVWAYEDE